MLHFWNRYQLSNIHRRVDVYAQGLVAFWYIYVMWRIVLVYTKSIYHHFVAQEQNDQWIITLSAMKPMKTKSLWSRNAQLHNILPEGPRVLSGLWPSGIPLHRSPIIISSNSAIPGTSLCKWLPLCNVHYIVVYLVHTLVVGVPFTVVYHMLCLLSPDGAAPHLTQSPMKPSAPITAHPFQRITSQF